MATDDTRTAPPADEPRDGSQTPLNSVWATILGIYLLFMCLLLSYMLYKLWPPERHTAAATATEQTNTRKTNRGENQNANSGSSNANNSARGTNTNAAGNNNTSRTPSGTNANTSSSTNSNANTNSNSANSVNANDAGDADKSKKEAEQNDTKTAAEEMLPPVSLFRGYLTLTHSVEVRLLLVALLAGALGAFIHAATSFADFVGNRKLGASWVWWYVLRPFIGMALALIFYFAVRGGFIAPSAGAGDMNPYGIAAMAALVGMFSKQATDKLNDVFTSLFGSKGDEKRGDKLQGPTVTSVDPNVGKKAGGEMVKIVGTGFIQGAGVILGTKAATSVLVDTSGKFITAKTPALEGSAAGDVRVDVQVTNKNGEKATLAGGFTYQD